MLPKNYEINYEHGFLYNKKLCSWKYFENRNTQLIKNKTKAQL